MARNVAVGEVYAVGSSCAPMDDTPDCVCEGACCASDDVRVEMGRMHDSDPVEGHLLADNDFDSPVCTVFVSFEP